MQKDNNDEKNEYIPSSKEETFFENVISPEGNVLDGSVVQQQQQQQHKRTTLPSQLSPLKKKGRASSTSSTGSNKGSKWYEKSKRLGMDFVPAPLDVICARGNVAWNHPGNKYFRALVRGATDSYSKTETKADRTAILKTIVEAVRSKGGTGFVKREASMGGEWIEVGDLLAREKAAQMMRNSLSGMYRSSLKKKKQRRKNVQAKRADNLHDLLESNKNIKQCMKALKEGASRSNRSLSDEKLTTFFTKEQCRILDHIKADKSLVERFCQAEVTACLIMNNEDETASDGDIQMTHV